MKRNLTEREFNVLSSEKRQLLGSAKPGSTPEPGTEKAMDAYKLVRSLHPESVALLPKGYKQQLLERLTKEQLRSLPQSVQNALKAAK